MGSVLEDRGFGAKRAMNGAVEFVMEGIEGVTDDESLQKLKEVPRRVLGPFLKLIAAGVFAFALWYNYTNNIGAQFLSLDGNSSSQVCYEVPIAVTGKYQMDSPGYWSGSTAYNPSRAVYSFEMNSFKHTTAEYVAIMTNLQSRVSAMASSATSRTFTQNLEYWMSWAQVIDDGNYSMRFQLSGSVPSVFDSKGKQAILSNSRFDCRAIPVLKYNQWSGQLDITYSYEKYQAETHCTSISTPVNLG